MAERTRVTIYNNNPEDHLGILKDPYEGMTEEEKLQYELWLRQLEDMPRPLSYEFICEEQTTDA